MNRLIYLRLKTEKIGTPVVTGKEIHTQRNRFFMAFLEKSRKECVKMGLAHEKKSYLQEKANLFEIGSEVK